MSKMLSHPFRLSLAALLSCMIYTQAIAEELTPNGAIKAGNAEGTIPAWTGGMTEPPAGWSPEQGYLDPFKDESPVVVVNHANMAQHKDKLTPGIVAMLEKYPDSFNVPVYPTHRTFAN